MSEQVPAKDRLRAFEDEVMGADAPRVNGHIERGHGSLFGRLSAEHKAHHARLEHLVTAEQKLADASVKLAEAQAEHDKALVAAGVEANFPEPQPDGLDGVE